MGFLGYRVMATLKQKTLFQLVLENAQKRNPKTLGELMRESGYGKISKQCTRVVNSKGFKKLMEKLDDEVVLARFYEILLGKDSRSSLDAGEKILKLKDRYPKQSGKVIGLFQAIDELQE